MQPLVTLNDPVFLECAQQLARTMQDYPASGLHEKFAHAHRLTTQHEISESALDILASTYQELVEEYKETPFEKIAESAEEAAYVNVASILLNIDSA